MNRLFKGELHNNKYVKFFWNIVVGFYSFLFGIKRDMPWHIKLFFLPKNKFNMMGNKNVIRFKGGKCKWNIFWIHGGNNEISIGEGSRIERVTFEISGSNNQISIGANVTLRNSKIHIGDNQSILMIGNNTDIGGGARIVVLEGGKVSIGEDCMFSTNISIMNSDSHSVVDMESDCRINAANDVLIGNHVWFGQDVTVLKGVEIEDDVVIGNRSMLTKGIYRKNCIFAGTPAKIIRGGCRWLRERI